MFNNTFFKKYIYFKFDFCANISPIIIIIPNIIINKEIIPVTIFNYLFF